MPLKQHITAILSTMKASDSIQIVSYKPEYASYFERFNKAWLEEYFTIEPIDRYVLENPEEAIIQPGGSILFAVYKDVIIGVVALRLVAPGEFELTKMAVDKAHRGIGAGKLLCNAAIEEAQKLKAHTLILYSSSPLQNAIGIYKKLGFVDLPLEKGVYARADVKMGYPLTE